MPTRTLRKPIFLPIRPVVRGLNTAVPPQTIRLDESPSLLNIRFRRGQIQKRDGFSIKFKGADGAVLRVEMLPSATELLSSSDRKSIVLTKNKIFYDADGVLAEVAVYDGNGSVDTTPFTMDPSENWFSIDVGTGTVDFNPDSDPGNYANSGDVFGADFIAVIGNGKDGVLIVAYTGETVPVEGQFIHANWALGGPSLAVAVAVFDNRLVVGGTSDGYSVVQWSSIGRFDHWDTGTYADTGEQVLGDSADRIQAMKKLGEYLVVYKERSIYIGRKSYLSDPAILFSPAPNQGIGLAAPNSIGVLGDEHIFLGSQDVYAFSLNRFDSIGFRVRDEMFAGDDAILPSQIHNSIGAVVSQYGEYWLFVPTGKWPTDSLYGGSGPTGSVENILLNPCFNDDDTSWTVSGTGATSEVQEGAGTFGPNMLRVTAGAGEAATLINTEYDYDAVLDGKLFSVLAWVKGVTGTVSVTLQVRTYDSAGANETVHADTAESVVAADGLTRLSFSVYISDADAEQITAALIVNTLSGSIDVDCMQLVSMDGIDTKYRYSDGDALVPGFIGPSNAVQIIPFIVDRVGQWMLDTCWVYNYEYDSWSKWRLPLSGFGIGLISSGDAVTIADLVGTIEEQSWIYDSVAAAVSAPTPLLGQVDGQVWKSIETNTYDFEQVLNSAVLAFWESKDIDLDKPSEDKTMSRLIIYHNADHPSSELTVSISTDSGATWSEQTVTMRYGYTQTFADFFVTGHQIRFRVQSSEDIAINGFEAKIIQRGESNAY